MRSPRHGHEYDSLREFLSALVERSGNFTGPVRLVPALAQQLAEFVDADVEPPDHVQSERLERTLNSASAIILEITKGDWTKESGQVRLSALLLSLHYNDR